MAGIDGTITGTGSVCAACAKGDRNVMRKIIKCISLIIISSLLLVTSVAGFNAVTLYTDGDYTFADADAESVALYGYNGSSSALVVPASCNGRYVSSVYNYAFEDNTSITAIDFSQASRFFDSIGMKSFVNCTGLSGTLSLPASITSLGHGAFQGCTNITELQMNACVAQIPSQCFNKCASLRTVITSPFVESIDNLAFANCPYLQDIYLSTAVTYISDTAFLNSNRVRFQVFYDSYARVYAQEHGFSYVLRDGVKLSDVNGDNNVNINDVTMIQRHLAELESVEGIYLYVADVNRDGAVDIADATALQMYLAEYDMSNPIGEILTQ